jgi:hypothetical protein
LIARFDVWINLLFINSNPGSIYESKSVNLAYLLCVIAFSISVSAKSDDQITNVKQELIESAFTALSEVPRNQNEINRMGMASAGDAWINISQAQNAVSELVSLLDPTADEKLIVSLHKAILHLEAAKAELKKTSFSREGKENFASELSQGAGQIFYLSTSWNGGYFKH